MVVAQSTEAPMTALTGFILGVGVSFTVSLGFTIVMIICIGKQAEADLFEPAHKPPVREPGLVTPLRGRALSSTKT
jgi:hypothetical protein